MLLRFALVAAASTRVASLAPKPNFVMLLADDWGWGDYYADVGGTGVEPNHTPNLNRMAARGTLFVDFHVANPVCSPSRTGFMTGRGPSQFRIDTALNHNWTVNEQQGQSNFLPTSTPTVTSILQQSGYATGHFGKWHLGSGTGVDPISNVTSAPVPTEYGIDESCTFNSNDPCLADARTANSSTMIIDSSIDFIARQATSGRPFYANVWLHVSHDLLDPSAAQKAACVANSPLCACDHLATNQTTCVQQIFLAAQQDADVQIGRLLGALATLDLEESTLVIFTTDNGPEERYVYQNAGGSAGPFRGRKRSLYEGGHRVPFIAQWGGGTPKPTVAASVVDNTLLGAVDWLPTVLALAGVALPPALGALSSLSW